MRAEFMNFKTFKWSSTNKPYNCSHLLADSMLTMLLTIITTIAVVLGALVALYFSAGHGFRMMMLARRQAGSGSTWSMATTFRTSRVRRTAAIAAARFWRQQGSLDHDCAVSQPAFHLYVPDLPGFGDASRVDDAHYGGRSAWQDCGVCRRGWAVRFHLAGNSMVATLGTVRAPVSRALRAYGCWPAGAMSAEPSEVLTRIDQGENPRSLKRSNSSMPG